MAPCCKHQKHQWLPKFCPFSGGRRRGNGAESKPNHGLSHPCLRLIIVATAGVRAIPTAYMRWRGCETTIPHASEKRLLQIFARRNLFICAFWNISPLFVLSRSPPNSSHHVKQFFYTFIWAIHFRREVCNNSNLTRSFENFTYTCFQFAEVRSSLEEVGERKQIADQLLVRLGDSTAFNQRYLRAVSVAVSNSGKVQTYITLTGHMRMTYSKLKIFKWAHKTKRIPKNCKLN